MISDDELCSICADHSRDHRTICVVENVRDVMSIENTGQFRGVYHVLGGIISPINGIGPSDLTVKELVHRIEVLFDEVLAEANASVGLVSAQSDESAAAASSAAARAAAGQKIEVILALSGDVEGETTSFYIYRQLARFGIKVSSLARGLGFGDDLEYADSLTLGRSLTNRQIFHP